MKFLLVETFRARITKLEHCIDVSGEVEAARLAMCGHTKLNSKLNAGIEV